MLLSILGLAGALAYGTADFFGGLASRRITALPTSAIAAAAGLTALALTLPWLGGEWSASAIGLGVLAGLAGAVALPLLYACLALGPMSILSPLTAVVSALVPMSVGLARGESLSPLGYGALGLALIAVVLVGFVPEKGAVRPSLRGVLMAIGSGAAIGVFLILIDLTPEESGINPLIVGRFVNALIMGTAAVLIWRIGVRRVGAGVGAARALPVRPRTLSPTVRAGLLLAMLGGLCDACANVLILIGLRLGELSVMSVLVAMYPAGTILLAALVLRERIAPVQWVGLALALTAAGLLALA
ncbi:EamA family transporter [Microterricola viridarii]|uniref:EamA-like transporter family protein n=1 Tax=Microterricola viridarii TaxID=412690 RepID=A0A1H1P3Y5_9MICO|nr:EamA family transporter [Microterricola viridarii]SDS05902.1 EamA-like transporter family protein [Microterricola viridarii]